MSETNTWSRIIPIVTINDTIIWYKIRDEITVEDIYRVSACWIVDSQWLVLLQQRAFTKKHSPGKRGPACAWTIEKWETYESNIIHELLEEVNIQVSYTDITKWEKMFSETSYKKFCQWFTYTFLWDKSLIKPEQGTIEQLRRRKPEEIISEYKRDPNQFVGSTDWCIQTFL